MSMARTVKGKTEVLNQAVMSTLLWAQIQVPMQGEAPCVGLSEVILVKQGLGMRLRPAPKACVPKVEAPA